MRRTADQQHGNSRVIAEEQQQKKQKGHEIVECCRLRLSSNSGLEWLMTPLKDWRCPREVGGREGSSAEMKEIE